MCGIAGCYGPMEEDPQALALSMAKTLRHRGPDGIEAWSDPSAGIAFGHARLSIQDLSPAGRQPMASACGRYMVTFNGEIYNFIELRKELEDSAAVFRGHSDTEVLLALISRTGVEAAVRRLNGMFAFALWDRRERALYLVRDRLGEKPLYYGWIGGAVLFASELKALRAYPRFDGRVDRNAAALYLRYNCIPSPYSIYKGIRKLPPGTILKLDSPGAAEGRPIPYWSTREAAERGIARPFQGTDQEAAQRLESLLGDAVRMRMVADVPLGAFLSGGIDSSSVVALMRSRGGRPVKTFTIGFSEPDYNEAEDAKAVARHLGADHTELYVAPSQVFDVIRRLPDIYDEPFADSSQIPTFLVSELARRHVTVSLSGDGGDEIFAGYNRYAWGRSLWGGIGSVPRPMRSVAAKALTLLSPRSWDKTFAAAGSFLPEGVRQRTPGDKLHKLAEVLAAESPEMLYYGLVSHWKDPASVVLSSREEPTAFTRREDWAKLPGFAEWMVYLDTVSYLPDDILVKLDRASMGVSLESRVPFLDHRVVEFAWSLPFSMKIRGGQGKWLLRQVLYRHVPRELVDRPKMGFAMPLGDWLRGPLRGWAEDLLGERRLREGGIFDPIPIRTKWQEHLSGRWNWQYLLWDILMFEAWRDRWE